MTIRVWLVRKANTCSLLRYRAPRMFTRLFSDSFGKSKVYPYRRIFETVRNILFTGKLRVIAIMAKSKFPASGAGIAFTVSYCDSLADAKSPMNCRPNGIVEVCTLMAPVRPNVPMDKPRCR